MIKRLRIVFITVTMFLVTVMVASIFLIVLQTTYSHMSERNLAILQKLDQESFRAPWPDFPEPLPQNCFILTVGVDGSVKVTSGYNNIPDEVIRRLILDKARSSQRRSGFFYDYGLMYYQLNDPENVSYAFLDISDEISTMQTLVINCLIIGLGTLVLCLPVCWLLARAITQPVAYSLAQQRQFLADASHELKTPLTVILTNAELLQSSDFTQQEKLRFSASIQSVAKQMRSLLEDMLNLARLDHSTQDQDLVQVSLSDLAEECCMMFAPVYYESGRDLHYVVEPDIWIWGNEKKLQQMVDILLDNGNKYSSAGSRVTLRLQRQNGNRCLLQVSSRGKTLTSQQCKDIFKRFYRVDSARTESGSTGSFGLGLPIAQQTTREHRGKMWCAGKEGVNTFYAQFPMSNH
jgi:signal transduction histidine kinase